MKFKIPILTYTALTKKINVRNTIVNEQRLRRPYSTIVYGRRVRSYCGVFHCIRSLLLDQGAIRPNRGGVRTLSFETHFTSSTFSYILIEKKILHRMRLFRMTHKRKASQCSPFGAIMWNLHIFFSLIMLI
jgi:uncharacterized protein (UPF0332 family)